MFSQSLVLARADLTITPRLRRQLGDWLQEDLGRGDLTTPALQGRQGQAHWVAKADGVFCGGVLVEPLLRELQPPNGGCNLHVLVADGAPVKAGDRLLELEGPAPLLVALERTALNLAMRLSGIASATATLVAMLLKMTKSSHLVLDLSINQKKIFLTMLVTVNHSFLKVVDNMLT